MSDINDSPMSNKIPMFRVVKLQTEKGDYPCDNVIVATGGVSYPTTGSTGDGYRFATEHGHSLVPLKSGLCGINLIGNAHKTLQGLALKNVCLTVKNQEKIVYSGFGEMLFTHFGISGPLVLTASSYINRLPIKTLRVFLDLKPALDEQTLDKRLLRDFETHKNKKLFNALVDLLPQKLIAIVLSIARIPADKNVNVLTKEERASLLHTLKNLPLQVDSLRGFEEAIITSGGVELSEINPKTMESKFVAGLKFAGEVLDVDALTGGFNLQIAFSTGFAAGNTIK